MVKHPENQCLRTALRLLTFRDHSCAELARKLKLRGFSVDQIKHSVEECERLNYLDDERFSHIYVRQLRRKGFGPARIREKLRAKGIPQEMVQEVLVKDIPRSTQTEDCRLVLEKKMNRSNISSDPHALKGKLYRFLSGRGFSPEVIRQILKENPSLNSTVTEDRLRV